jgi:hypothetical protein
MADSKTDQGVALALAAVAEYLQKADARESSMVKAQMIKKQQAAEAVAKQAFISEIKAAILPEIKKAIGNVTGESKQGMEADESEKESVAGKTKWPMSGNTPGEDQEKPADPRTATKDVQKVIQASQDGREENEEEGKAGGAFAKEDFEEEGSEDYPHKEDEFDGDEKEEVKMLRKQIKSLQKAVSTLSGSGNYQADVKKAVQAELSKVGFKESNELSRGRVFSLGVDENDGWIAKSQKANTADDYLDALAGASYGELARLEIENGKFNTNSALGNLFGGK